MKNMKTLNPLLPVLGFVLVWATGCGRHDASRPDTSVLPRATVRVFTVETAKHVSTEETVGTVRATLQARIEAKVAGRIVEMEAVPGRAVKAGTRLVRLDAQEVRARLEQALALQEQAASDLKRYTALLQRAAATQAEFDAVQSRARVAEAAVQEARSLLGNTEIVAPFDGVVTRKWADVGDLASPGKPLVELEDPTRLRLEADVGEALIDRIELGQHLEVRVPALPAALQASVVEIAPTADPASRTFVVKLDLPTTSGLRPGQFGRVAIPVGESTNLRVPAEAVIVRGQLEYVVVVADDRAQLRLVRTGKRHGAEIELLAGAEAGERVAVSDPARLRDGQPLQIQP